MKYYGLVQVHTCTMTRYIQYDCYNGAAVYLNISWISISAEYKDGLAKLS